MFRGIRRATVINSEPSLNLSRICDGRPSLRKHKRRSARPARTISPWRCKADAGDTIAEASLSAQPKAANPMIRMPPKMQDGAHFV